MTDELGRGVSANEPRSFRAVLGGTEVGVEHVVAAAWRRALDTPGPVADADDFFLTGGNSLLAVSFVTEIESALDISFPLHALFLDGRFATVVSECSARRGSAEGSRGSRRTARRGAR